MKKFIYLVQGRSDLVRNYLHLKERSDADVILLTYDEKIENALYCPNSTWSEGRNILLDSAKAKGEYLYYIYCDDDIEFVKGGWDEYENLLLKYKPAIGCPVFPKNKRSPIHFFEMQLICILDQQLIAYHRDLVLDGLILPYQQIFDDFSWWAAGAIENLIIENFYSDSAIQFNNVRILNKVHGRYDLTNSKINYPTCVEWFGKECKNGFKRYLHLNEYKRRVKLKVLLKTLISLFFNFRKKPDYRLNVETLNNFFKSESFLLKQYKEYSKGH